LLIVLEKRHKDITLIKALTNAVENDQHVKSLKDLRAVVGESTYIKIIKDINF